jgi:hypothetical protein
MDKTNFFIGTYANWTSVSEVPNRTPDYISESYSNYWYSNKGVVRLSDHWGVVSSNFWELDKPGAIGFCTWKNFHKIVQLKSPYITQDLNSEQYYDNYYLDHDYIFVEFGLVFKAKMVYSENGPRIEGHPNHIYTDYINVVENKNDSMPVRLKNKFKRKKAKEIVLMNLGVDIIIPRFKFAC